MSRKYTHTTPTHVNRQTDQERAWGRPRLLQTGFKMRHTYECIQVVIILLPLVKFFFVWRTKGGIRTGRRWMYEQKVYTHDTNTCKQTNREGACVRETKTTTKRVFF